MQLKDKDLVSIQETRNLLQEAHKASKILAAFSMEKINNIVKSMADAAYKNRERLARMANEETGFGIYEDKVLKNIFGSLGIYDAIREEKTIGILAENKVEKTIDIGVPIGVIAGLIPSTNPTSTVMYKALISLKAGNAIVFSPHPNAINCIMETIKILQEAASKAGCPPGAIGGISIPTLEGTNELMKNKYTKLILATGGYAMVKAAYSSGTPAIGVGAGNGPAFIDKTADIAFAVKQIIESKTFDNGTICASEQSILIEKVIEAEVTKELKEQGAYLLSEIETKQLGQYILRANGTMNPAIVGKSVENIARLSGLLNIPSQTRVLVAKVNKVGKDSPFSHEKLAPILGYYVEENKSAVIKRAIEILEFEGSGHTFMIHTKNEELVKEVSLQIPASRILINTCGSLGGIGATTNLFPALTLGCGAVGGSSSSNNIGPIDLINIKRVAYGIKTLEDLRKETKNKELCSEIKGENMEKDQIEFVIRKVLNEYNLNHYL